MAYGEGDQFHGACLASVPATGHQLTREIGIVVFEGFSLLAAAVIPEVLQYANELRAAHVSGASLYNVQFFSAEGGNVVSSSSIAVRTLACRAAEAAGFAALFVADGRGARRAARNDSLLAWLGRVIPRSGLIKTWGEGLRVLEAACLCGDRQGQAAAAWNADPGTFDEGEQYEPVRTALMLVKRDLGTPAARAIAERLPPLGESLRTSLFPEGVGVSVADKIQVAARWMRDNCARRILVVDAARVAAMSERNFLRCFRRETGLTPSEFLLQARLDMTSRLLADTDFPINRIATRCGCISGDRLARVFQQRFAMTPAEYRTQARNSRAAIS